MPKQQPPQQAPPVQRLRIRYAKRGRLRFISHRDFSRAFERALMRARVPMAYSSGFNPRPRISYAGAAPTGAASEAEYVEIGLSSVQDPAEVLALLDSSLPPGLDVITVIESPGGGLSDRLEASHWEIDLGVTDGVEEAVAAFEAATEVLVERMTKKGRRQFDARAAVVRIAAVDGLVRAVIRHGEPMVRPDDVANALAEVGGLTFPATPLYNRLSQGPLDEAAGEVLDPLVG